MCELIYIKNHKEQNLTQDKIRKAMRAAQNASQDNPHGAGVFNRAGAVWRTEGTIEEQDIHSVAKLFQGSKEMVIHLRYGTVGTISFDNVHPFTTEQYILSHNGRMSKVNGYGEQEDADSKQFTLKIDDQEGTGHQPIKQALEKSSGWYSIFTLDRYEDSLYYYRKRASFTFQKTQSHIYGATRKHRLENLPNSGEKIQEEQTPKEETIYQITGSQIKQVAQYQHQKHTASNSNTSTRIYYNGKDQGKGKNYHWKTPSQTKKEQEEKQEASKGIDLENQNPLEDLYEKTKDKENDPRYEQWR